MDDYFQKFQTNLLQKLHSKKVIAVSMLILILIIIFIPNPFSATPLPTSNSYVLYKIILLFSQDSAKSAFDEQFSFIQNSYSIEKVVLLSPSKVAILAKTNNGAIYRSVWQKEKGSWKMLITPEIIINYQDYPNLSRSLIKTLNNLKVN